MAEIEDLSGSRRLIIHGFLAKDEKETFTKLKSKFERYQKLRDIEYANAKKAEKGEPVVDIDKFAENHGIDKTSDQIVLTGYPTPVKWHRLIHETAQKNIESFYFWSMNCLTDLGFPQTIKITDVFATAEMSSMYGVSAQRLGLAQDKVAQYLATIGRLVKDLFQIVREIRWIRERKKYYEDANSKEEKTRVLGEIALKGMYVDLVEGGTKSAGSVYGMGTQVGFTPLPDLFFSIHPRTTEDIDKAVNGKDFQFNNKLKEVLARKLYQYIRWRDETYKEIMTREKQTLKYLRQHYDSILLYLNWVKPYLKHIKRLSLSQKKMDSSELIGAFESSAVEIEVLAYQLPKGNSSVYACLLLAFNYRSTPTMPFVTPDYQGRGPLHMGRFEVIWRGYAWSKKQIDDYTNMRHDEDFELISTIDSSLKEAIDSLGDELKKYLEDAGEKLPYKYEPPKEKPTEEEQQVSVTGLLEPFTLPFKGVTDIIKPLLGRAQKKDSVDLGSEVAAAIKGARGGCWNHYKLFKKANKFITW